MKLELIIESDVREFIDRLPALSVDRPTVHLLMLAIRSRIAKELLGVKIRDLVVERKIIRPTSVWKQRYFNKVYNLALLQHHGRYHYRDTMVPSESMAIYATLSPRDVLRAVAESLKLSVNDLYQRDESSLMSLSRQDIHFFSNLHKHRAKGSMFVTLDLDVLDKSLMYEIKEMVEEAGVPIWMITETSRGYHIILNLSKEEHARVFYGQESLLHKLRIRYASKGLEIQKDSQECVPGTRYYRKDSSRPFYVRILE